MIRFAASPEGALVPDVAARLPGRGAWIKAEKDILTAALEKGHLARALGIKDPDISAVMRLETLLVQRCQQMLSIGRRGGMVIGGAGKIKAIGDVAGLVIATDASKRETRAFVGDVRHDWQVNTLGGEELGAVFARPSLAFVAALAQNGDYIMRLRNEFKRLDIFRLHEET